MFKIINKISLSFFILLLVLSSCTDVGVGPNTKTEVEDIRETISFSNLKVGQKSKYLYFIGANYFSSNDQMHYYTGDTLIVEVVSKDETGWVIRESISLGSPVLNGEKSYSIEFANTIITYHLSLDEINNKVNLVFLNNSIPYSHLHSYLSSFQSLDLNPYSSLISYSDNWGITNLATSSNGLISNYKLLGKTYQNVNANINNTAMQHDGTGKTLLYSKSEGIIRSYTVNPWQNSGRGWDAVVDSLSSSPISNMMLRSLANSNWKLTHFKQYDSDFKWDLAAKYPEWKDKMNLSFPNSSELNGEAACNSMIGKYNKSSLDSISINISSATKVACNPTFDYQMALDASYRILLSKSKMVLYSNYPLMKVMYFERK